MYIQLTIIWHILSNTYQLTFPPWYICKQIEYAFYSWLNEQKSKSQNNVRIKNIISFLCHAGYFLLNVGQKVAVNIITFYQLISNQYFILIFGIHIIILLVTSILLQICILLQSSQTLIFIWFRTWYESTWWICNTILSWWKKLIGINLSYLQNNKLTFYMDEKICKNDTL